MVNPVIDVRSPEALLEELSSVERQLMRAMLQPDFVRVLARLNELRNDTLGAAQPQWVRARYFFIRALAYAKPARISQAGFLQHSATECLIYALEMLEEDAKTAIELAAHESGCLPEVERLQHDCAYEAAVIHTVLNAWGSPRKTRPDLRTLFPNEQQKVTKALTRHYSLYSRV